VHTKQFVKSDNIKTLIDKIPRCAILSVLIWTDAILTMLFMYLLTLLHDYTTQTELMNYTQSSTILQ